METIYRIEQRERGHGMWYNEDGEYDPYVENLTDKRLFEMDMSHDPNFHNNGNRLHCGCGSTEQLKQWFTAREVQELKTGGFVILRLDVSSAIHQPTQVLFDKSSIRKCKEIDFVEIFGASHLNSC